MVGCNGTVRQRQKLVVKGKLALLAVQCAGHSLRGFASLRPYTQVACLMSQCVSQCGVGENVTYLDLSYVMLMDTSVKLWFHER
eukprot:32043-Amphidinium_carterae.1